MGKGKQRRRRNGKGNGAGVCKAGGGVDTDNGVGVREEGRGFTIQIRVDRMSSIIIRVSPGGIGPSLTWEVDSRNGIGGLLLSI